MWKQTWFLTTPQLTLSPNPTILYSPITTSNLVPSDQWYDHSQFGMFISPWPTWAMLPKLLPTHTSYTCYTLIACITMKLSLLPGNTLKKSWTYSTRCSTTFTSPSTWQSTNLCKKIHFLETTVQRYDRHTDITFYQKPTDQQPYLYAPSYPSKPAK